MKTYIQPQTSIEHAEMIIMAGLSLKGAGGDGNQLGNEGFFDDMEDSYPPKDKNLWDDAYSNKD